MLGEPGGDAFIEKTRRGIPRHIFGDVREPQAASENHK